MVGGRQLFGPVERVPADLPVGMGDFDAGDEVGVAGGGVEGEVSRQRPGSNWSCLASVLASELLDQ